LSNGEDGRRKRIIRTTIFLVGVALAFYLGFIMIGVIRA